MRLVDSEIIREIRKQPTITQEELAKRLSCHPITVYRCIKRLTVAGIISKQGYGNRKSYTYEVSETYEPMG